MKKSKHIIRNCISLVLVLMMMLSVFAVSINAEEQTAVYPTIYIKGQGSTLLKDASKKSEYNKNGKPSDMVTYPPKVEASSIIDVLDDFSLIILREAWDEYGELLYDTMEPYVADMRCDKNGNVSNGSGPADSSSTSAQRLPHSGGKSSDFKVWSFSYDWRLDPNEIANELNDYIDLVKTKTNSEKVNIIARCLGGNIMLSYFNKFGAEDINDCVMCCIGFEGFESFESIFSGNIDLDADAIERFASKYLTTDKYAGDPMFGAIRYFISLLSYSPVLPFASNMVENVVDNLRDNGLAKILRDSAASWPSFWAFIGDNSYVEAKEYIYGGVEEEYAAMIEKIDNYHYNVLNKYDEILNKAEADGARIYNVCKYGFQMIPVNGDCNLNSDTLISAEKTSLGATFSSLNGALSASYIKAADAKYISPDKQVDASTCKYPEHTWFIKNLSHRNMPEIIDSLFEEIINFDGYTTVDDLEEYPQFLMSSDDATVICPATAENSSSLSDTKPSPLEALLLFLLKLLTFVFKRLVMA